MSRIIGIGSPFGDDQVGWNVIEFLKLTPLKDEAELITLDRPYLQLLPFLKDTDCVYLIDALYSGGMLGSIVEINDLSQLRISFGTSSHQLGLAEVLDLAASLKQLPCNLHIFGIEIACPKNQTFISENLSPEVLQGAKDLALLLCSTLSRVGAIVSGNI